MEQNLKKLFEQDRFLNHTRKATHEDLFIEQLYKELPEKRNAIFSKFRIAASILILLGVGLVSYLVLDNPFHQKEAFVAFSLKDISPDLENIENFYVTNINQTLLEIENTNNSQAYVSRYLNRLALLKKEYKNLISELNTEGPNSQGISVLIHNLKLQLELLQELKEQLTPVKKNLNETI